MPFNLMDEDWLPVRRLGGSVEAIAPWRITESYDTDPVVALAAPRPDFNGALLEFLIGLLTTAAAPDDDDSWFDGWGVPLTPDTLRVAFAGYRQAFDLDGDGPRFMQDLDPLEDGKETPVSALLIDAPGAQTLRNNADHFVNRGSAPALGRAAAAAALYTLQTYAPSGGAGHRTSLRGGGPLTTVVVGARHGPASGQQRETLWTLLWPNVRTKRQIASSLGDPAKTKPADIFPWLAPTRASDKSGRNTTPRDTHPLQAFWGMPRRIRLDFTPAAGDRCALFGMTDSWLVRGYRTRPYGINYEGGWQHPLTPYSRQGNAEPLPRHADPGGVTYRQWLGLIQADTSTKSARTPAAVVIGFQTRRQPYLKDVPFRLTAFGYDMDNMKARCWYEGTMPLVFVDEAHRNAFENAVKQLLDAAVAAATATTHAVKNALFARPTDVKGDFGAIGDRLWRDTERDFETALHRLRQALEKGDELAPMNVDWQGVLRHAATAIFDDAIDLDTIGEGAFKRIVKARQGLVRTLMGPKIRKILDLQQEIPTKPRTP